MQHGDVREVGRDVCPQKVAVVHDCGSVHREFETSVSLKLSVVVNRVVNRLQVLAERIAYKELLSNCSCSSC